MSIRVKNVVREPEPPSGLYEEIVANYKEQREQTSTGTIVVRSKETPFENARQGRVRFFSHKRYWPKLAAPGWTIFEQDIRRHSGKHVHQGGLAIFVLEGIGYTVVDGVRYDWQAGDLILMPVKPGGCEHQHFNLEEGSPCRWIAFSYRPFKDAIANQLVQRELSSEYNAAE